MNTARNNFIRRDIEEIDRCDALARGRTRGWIVVCTEVTESSLT
jgi:hypothetical protein